jgi:acetyl esterase/lipase
MSPAAVPAGKGNGMDSAQILGGFPTGPGMGPDMMMPQADISRVARKWLDVAYADVSSAQKLDIYLPDRGDGPFPVIVHIHGGAFAIGDKRDAHLESYLCGLERGYAVVSLNYRLSGEAVFPAGLRDVKAAIRWLRAHSSEYRLDAGRFAACGGSSGANYAAMVGVTDGVELFDDPVLGNPAMRSDVQAVVDWFGPTDFSRMDEQLAANGLGPCDHSGPDSPESRYLGAHLKNAHELVEAANPMTYVNDRMPPILIQHGTLDSLVPYQQSLQFARRIEERLGPGRCELELLDGAGHDDPAFDTEQNRQRVLAFLDQYLR